MASLRSSPFLLTSSHLLRSIPPPPPPVAPPAGLVGLRSAAALGRAVPAFAGGWRSGFPIAGRAQSRRNLGVPGQSVDAAAPPERCATPASSFHKFQRGAQARRETTQRDPPLAATAPHVRQNSHQIRQPLSRTCGVSHTHTHRGQGEGHVLLVYFVLYLDCSMHAIWTARRSMRCSPPPAVEARGVHIVLYSEVRACSGPRFRLVVAVGTGRSCASLLASTASLSSLQ